MPDVVPFLTYEDGIAALILQRDIDHFGLLLFRFNAFSVRLR